MIWIILASIVGGMGLTVGLVYLSKHWNSLSKPQWLSNLVDDVPWAERRQLTIYTEGRVGPHDGIAVSRHHIAESGLRCPVCDEEAVPRADFRRVRRAIVDGRENEVVQCENMREVNEGQRKVIKKCGLWLIASPDTEHGDHLDTDGTVIRSIYELRGRLAEAIKALDGALSEDHKEEALATIKDLRFKIQNYDTLYDPPSFRKFVRITPEQALREEWGMDVKEERDAQGNPILITDEAERLANKEEVGVLTTFKTSDQVVEEMVKKPVGIPAGIPPRVSQTADTEKLPTVKEEPPKMNFHD